MNKNFLFLSLLLVLNTSLVVAQATDEGPEPPPPAPVNQYVIFAIIFAVSMAFAFFSKTGKLQNSNDTNI